MRSTRNVIGFIFGLLLGLLAEWLIDASSWRHRGEQYSSGSPQQDRSSLESELLASRKEVQYLRERVRQLEQERTRLEEPGRQARPEIEAARTQPVRTQPPTPDNLEEIKGIGSVISRRLNENGIYTFDQLAALTPQDLRSILGEVIQRLADEESVLEQARIFALRKQSGEAAGE